MKANAIVGKKQIILAALVVILGGAVYLNWNYANKGGDFATTDALNQTSSQSQDADTANTSGDASGDGKNYGDAQLVSNGVEGDKYFAEVQLNRKKTRDEAIDTVKSVLEKTDASKEEIADATAKIVEISKQIEEEGKIESLIKAKGFEECVVYLDSESANVVVKTAGLEAEQAAQIKNIVLSEKEFKPENISITEVN